MNTETFDIEGPVLLTPRKFGDSRGYFMETFRASALNEITGQTLDFVQDNHSLSSQAFTVRGLHFQAPPHAQGKLVRCIRGEIIDIAVDARRESPTFGQYVRAHLTPENASQLWVPAGFLHGFATLAPDTEVVYKCTDYYAPECDGNVKWDDPDLAIDWGIDKSAAVVSDKDMIAPSFQQFDNPF